MFAKFLFNVILKSVSHSDLHHATTSLKTTDERRRKINFEDTIEYQEQKAFEQIIPELKEHIVYLDQIYEFCFSAIQSLNTKTYKQVSKQLGCQLMILMRITDFIRSIKFLIVKGYPEQSCTLAASIFELAHTAAYFLYTPEIIDKWYDNKDIEAIMPQLIGVKGYRDIVKKNYAYKNLEEHSDNEFKVYQQLCWIKHSHPVMQDLISKGNRVQFLVGPYTDDRSINHAWFSIQHSGRLTELVIGNLVELQDETFITEKLISLYKIRAELSKKAIDRFGNEDPFK